MTSNRSLSGAALALALLAGAGCSGAGSTAVPSAPQSQSSAFARGKGRPLADATHSYIYVADNYANTVWIFPAAGANPNPIGSITTGISGPQGLAIDAAGNLYVANSSDNSVTVYAPGSTAPSMTLRQGLTTPAAVAVDSKGNVWVSNELGSYGGSVVEFPAGKTAPTTTIGNLNPYGVAVDSAGNLYVENYTYTAAFVSVYSPGSTKASKTFGQSDLIEPLGIAIGPTGDVYVCDFQQNEVFIYGSRASHKLRHTTFVEEGDLSALTLSQNNRLYVTDSDMAVVSEIANRGFGSVVTKRLHNGLSSAYGVAADPPVAPGP